MMFKNQWLTLSIVFLFALLARIACAAPPVAQTSSAVFGPNRSHSVQVYGGPGLLVQSDAAGAQLTLGGLVAVDAGLPLHVGIETGVDILNYGSNSAPTSMSAVGIPILATAIYRFEKSKTEVPVTPFIGVSTGPNIYFVNTPGLGSRSTVYYELLLRGGVAFEVSSNVDLNIEPKIGIVGNSGTFITQASLIWAL